MSVDIRFDLSGKNAVVTGAARGIGRAIAEAFRHFGASVAIVDRVEHCSTPCDRYYQQDLAHTEALPELGARIWDEMGHVDILVNNAGIDYSEWFNEITLEHWRKVMAVNLDAAFFLTQPIAERMIDAGVAGRIINISSTNGIVAEAAQAHYNASKGGLELLTQSLAIELGPFGITVNALAPGLIETEIYKDLNVPQELIEYSKEHIPLQGRWGRVEDVAAAAVFLASDAGHYITGQHIVIDGGLTCDQFPRFKFLPPYRSRLKHKPASG